MIRKLCVGCVIGGILSAALVASAEREPMETAVDRSIAAGDFPQALANLERMRSSISIDLDDEFVRNRTDDAWGRLLDGKLAAMAQTGFEQLVALDSAVQQARRVGAAKTQKRLATVLESAVAKMEGEAQGLGLGAQLVRLRSIAAAASTSDRARDAVKQAEAKASAQLKRLNVRGLFGSYVAELTKAAYLLTAEPSHPRPIAARYALTTAASCAGVVEAVKASLKSTGTDDVAIELNITSCEASSQDRTSQREFEYQVREKVSRRVREQYVEEINEDETTCGNPTTRCSTEVENLTGVGLQITRTNCSTSPGQCTTRTVKKFVKAYRDVDKAVDEMVTHTERVPVTTRTTSVTVAGTAVLRMGSTQVTTPINVIGTASDESFDATNAGQSHSFGDIAANAVVAAGQHTSALLADNAQLAYSLQRAKDVRAQLNTATGDARLPLLFELAAQERKGEPELLNALATSSGLSVSELAEALRGTRFGAAAVPPHVTFDIELPAPDEAGVAGLRNDEERTVVNRTKITVGGFNIGLVTFSADARKYGATFGLNIARTPGLLAYRRVTGYGFIDGALQIAGGGIGETAFGFAGKVGLAAGMGFEQGGVFAHVAGGVDGIYLDDADAPLMVPGSTRVPAALGWGFGVALRVSKLYVSATRMMRFNDIYPERWAAEARWGRPFYLGISAYGYRTLLDQAGNKGPIAAMLILGVELDPSHLNKQLVGTEDRLR